ncbi:MAG TPA: HAD hydrolase-like protein [Gemmataceae bacterium]|nr:HAD hydrolase-like protein [Gemmataceae bacterium]
MYTVLFDIDGTLLSSGGAGKAAMEAALASEFGVTEVDDSVPFSGRTDRAIGYDLLQLHGIPNPPVAWPRLVAGYLRLLPGYLKSRPGQVLPGIAEMLKLLAERGDVSVGLLTGNVRDGARLKLGHYGIAHHFTFGGFGDDHLDRCDVAREALAAVRQRCRGDVDPSRIWVIGDTPLDIECARSIGARVVAVATGWHSLELLAEAKPDLLLPDLSNPEPLWSLWTALRK